MSEQQVYVFNQYYIDFLKKVKGFAKEQKETKKEARDILRAIKKHFSSMDKMSSEYVTFLKDSKFWEGYHSLEDKVVLSDEVLNSQFYQDISVQQIIAVVSNPFILHHYLCLMDIFSMEDVPVDTTIDIIKSVNNPTEFATKLETLQEKETLVSKLKFLQELHNKQARVSIDNDLKEIENTSLGKLAKELMSDINVEELQKTIMEPNMDILGSLQNPDSGFGKVLSTVSQKMISKLATGEINQDNLLQDAVQLATKLPGMMPGGLGNLGSQLGNLSSMFQQFQKMGLDTNSFGENMNPMDLMKSLGLSGPQRNAAAPRMRHAEKKQKTAERLKKKLAKHRENNIPREVEKDHE